jgi:hypothetical protein
MAKLSSSSERESFYRNIKLLIGERYQAFVLDISKT